MKFIAPAGPFRSLEEFAVESKLDEGGFASVFLARVRATGRPVALKLMCLEGMDPRNWVNIEQELLLHWNLRHERVVELLGFFRENETWTLVLEFVSLGSLARVCRARTLQKEEVRRIFRQTVEALVFIHQHHVVLRDLKPENILLTEALDVKVCDFGWATRVEDSPYNRECGGTLAYLPPETLRRQPQTEMADMWSLGVLLYELLHGKEPFRGSSEADLMAAIAAGPPVMSPCLPVEETDLILQLLRMDPSSRLNAAQLLQQPFLKVAGFPAPETSGFDSQRIWKTAEPPSLSFNDVFCRESEGSGQLPLSECEPQAAEDAPQTCLNNPPPFECSRISSSSGNNPLGEPEAHCSQLTEHVRGVCGITRAASSVHPFSEQQTTCGSATLGSQSADQGNQEAENQPVRVRLRKRFSVDTGILSLLSGPPTEKSASPRPALATSRSRAPFGEVTSSVINKR